MSPDEPRSAKYPGAGPTIECSKCGDHIFSRYVHDLRYCRCKATFVDGGSAYLRVGGAPVLNESSQVVIIEPGFPGGQRGATDEP